MPWLRAAVGRFRHAASNPKTKTLAGFVQIRWSRLHARRRVMMATSDPTLMQTAEDAIGQLHLEMLETGESDGVLHAAEMHDTPDLLILDAALPGVGGIALCGQMRSHALSSTLPIMMVTRQDDSAQHIQALDGGADDCVDKPLQQNMLVAHIRAIIRRLPKIRSHAHLRAGPIEMDLARWIAKVNGATVDLTHKEFRLLQVLLEARGHALTRDALLERVWAQDTPLTLDSRTVDVHIGRLRRKLGAALGRHIVTLRNVGFRFDLQPDWKVDTSPHPDPRPA
jgi:DNA-binding response OmpR family regulator